MYTVLIAEDELLVRMGIASSVPWAQMDMRIVAETADGAAAWDAFVKYHPDIVIEDIRMPKLDGMELLRRIRAEDAGCAVIIVTNVEHGPTLDEARRLGTSAVLIKATMKRDDITAAVIKARESLPIGRGSAAQLGDSGELWKEFIEAPHMTAAALQERCVRVNAAYFEPRGLVVLYIHPSETLSHRLHSSLVNLFEHRLGEKEDFCTVKLEGGFVAALMRGDYECERIEKTLGDLARYVRDNFGERLCFTLQYQLNGVEGLRPGLSAALRCFQKDALFDESVLRLNAQGIPDFPALADALHTLHRCLLLGTKGEALPQCVDRMEKLPHALAEGWQGALSLGREILNALGQPGEADFDGAQALVRAVAQAAEEASESIEGGVRPEIRAAIDYIRTHISDELSIRRVSEAVGYHPVYFSNLFKKEMEMSYSDFLTGLRIQRAKEMLSKTNLSLRQIAVECGFSDLSYFSAKFKRVVGTTPSQWRAKR